MGLCPIPREASSRGALPDSCRANPRFRLRSGGFALCSRDRESLSGVVGGGLRRREAALRGDLARAVVATRRRRRRRASRGDARCGIAGREAKRYTVTAGITGSREEEEGWSRGEKLPSAELTAFLNLPPNNKIRTSSASRLPAIPSEIPPLDPTATEGLVPGAMGGSHSEGGRINWKAGRREGPEGRFFTPSSALPFLRLPAFL